MKNKILLGKIIFINHEKHYATIEYTVNEKKKSINGNIGDQEQQRLKEAGLIKQVHHFNTGDDVSFILTPTAKGDRIVASSICFLYNNALKNMQQKAEIENRFTGYLKKTDAGYFVKETGSYIFLPLMLSPWEIPPSDAQLNEPVFFKLEHITRTGKATASLFKKHFIPEYNTALRLFTNKTIIDATVFKVTPHGIFVYVAGTAIKGKINIGKDEIVVDIKTGDTIKIMITHLSSLKIIIEKAAK